MSTFFDKFSASKLGSKKFRGVDHPVKEGRMDPDLIKIPTVSAINKTGNPRLWNDERVLRNKGTLKGKFTEDKIVKFCTDIKILSDTASSIKKLIEGMKVSGEPADPLFLDSEGNVVEGFRRLLGSRQLKADGDPNFKTVPVVVFGPSVTEEDIYALVGLLHITAKKRWDSVNRSQAAVKLRNEFGWLPSAIAQYFGWTLQNTNRYLRTYELHEEYRQEHKDYRKEIFTKFWKVSGDKELSNRMFDQVDDNYDPQLWKNFKRWIKDDKIKDCRHVANLVQKDGKGILQVPGAIKKLNKDDSTIAIEWIKQHAYESPIIKVGNELLHCIESLTIKDKTGLREDNIPARKARLVIDQLTDKLDELRSSLSDSDEAA